MTTSARLNASSIAVENVSSILASCCVIILASSWAAFLVGKRRGAAKVNEEDEDATTPPADNYESGNDRSKRTFMNLSLSSSSPSMPGSEGYPTTSSSNASPPSLPSALPPIQPIGTLQSIYRLCVGTPRQGMLVPHSRGMITFDENFISRDSVLELKHYSHVYVVFVFHLNSNTHKLSTNDNNTGTLSSTTTTTMSSSSSSTKSRQFPSKIAPPSLGGKKVGVFSTRTPHRPNPIGFSLCKLDKVVVSTTMEKKSKKMQQQGTSKTTFSLLLSGLDIVDGTPILDIKPYVPHYDCVGYTDNAIVIVNDDAAMEQFHGGSNNSNNNNTSSSSNYNNDNNSIVRVPQWVDSGLQKRRAILFLPAAEQFLDNLVSSSSSSQSPQPLLSKMQFYGPNSPWQDESPTLAVQHIRNVVIEVLTSDVRSVWQTAKARRGEFQAERSQRLTSLSTEKQETEKEDGRKSMAEGNDPGVMECCCTQQIDNLLVHYTIEGPTTTTTTDGSNTPSTMTKDERSMNSGAEDSVVVVSISFI